LLRSRYRVSLAEGFGVLLVERLGDLLAVVLLAIAGVRFFADAVNSQTHPGQVRTSCSPSASEDWHCCVDSNRGSCRKRAGWRIARFAPWIADANWRA